MCLRRWQIRSPYKKYIQNIFKPGQSTKFTLHSYVRNIYRPQTKLRKGNVFTDVCLFTDGGSRQYQMHHGIGHTVGYHLLEIRPAPPPPEQHLVVATETEARTVSKRAVCILLACFLVCIWFCGLTMSLMHRIDAEPITCDAITIQLPCRSHTPSSRCLSPHRHLLPRNPLLGSKIFWRWHRVNGSSARDLLRYWSSAI